MLAGYDILLKPQSFALQGVAVFLFFTVSVFGRCLVVVAVISAFLRPCPPLFKPCQCPHSGRGRADDVGSAHRVAPVPSVRPWSSTARSGRGGVSLIYPVTADTEPPVRADTLRPLERSGRRVLTGPRSDTRQAGPRRRRSEGGRPQ